MVVMNAQMKPNIILITIDALRADYTYDEGKVHPFLSKLIDEGIVFERAISPGPATNQSFRSLFTDLYPNESTAPGRANYDITEDGEFIAEVFGEMGYFTASFSNNANLTRVQGYDRGFDFFYDGIKEEESDSAEDSPGLSSRLKMKVLELLRTNLNPEIKFGKRFFGRLMSLFFYPGYESSKSLFNRTKTFLKENKDERPLFLWTHMMEIHSPYNLPLETFDKIGEERVPDWERQWLRHIKYRNERVSESVLSEEDVEKIKRMYKSGIRVVDDILRDFFNFLEKNDILEDSIVVITSDHGENLGDWDLLSHSDIYNSVLHVPLIIYDGKSSGKVTSTFGNSNLMGLLKCMVEEGDIKDCAEIYDGPAISEARRNDNILYSIQDEEYKLVFDEDEEEIMSYKMEDGKEKEEIKSDYNEDTIKLKNELLNHIRSTGDGERDKIKGAIMGSDFI